MYSSVFMDNKKPKPISTLGEKINSGMMTSYKYGSELGSYFISSCSANLIAHGTPLFGTSCLCDLIYRIAYLDTYNPTMINSY